MKIQLINPPIQDGYGGNSKEGAFPPLHLICLGTYLAKTVPDIEIQILDGEVMGLEEIELELGADIIGLSANFLNYSNCLRLAQIAKERGCYVILGGPYASSIPNTILQNRPEIDIIIVDDGERALSEFVKGSTVESIRNIVYRTRSQIHRNPSKNLDLNLLPIPDYGLINFKTYTERFYRQFSEYIPANRAAVLFSQKGCVWRDRTGGCIYCRPDTVYRAKAPKKSWEEIRALVERYGVNLIWDCSETLTTDKVWFEEFVTCKPADLNPFLMIYARENDITPVVAKMLHRINCYQILIGADSADNAILKQANTGKSLECIRSTAELLALHDIHLSASFVFGLPGETTESVEVTLDLIYWLFDLGNVFEISAGILFPLPGTICFSMMLRFPHLAAKYTNRDLFDFKELQVDWVKQFCHVSYEQLEGVLSEVSRAVPVTSSFGRRINY